MVKSKKQKEYLYSSKNLEKLKKKGFRKGHKLRVGMKHTKASKEKMSKPKTYSPESYQRLKDFRKGKHFSIKTEFKPGKRHPFWKGGITKDSQKRLNNISWRKLRKEIIKRDGNKCVICGGNKRLSVHHIIHWTQKVENKESLITLCTSCHRKLEVNFFK